MKKQFAIAFGLVTAHHILDIRQGNNLHGLGIWKKYSRYFCIEAISHAILSMTYFCVIVKNPVKGLKALYQKQRFSQISCSKRVITSLLETNQTIMTS